MFHKISFDTNNCGILELEQVTHDGHVIINRLNDSGVSEKRRAIKPTDFVMLLNLYEYIKENDIQNDFINPNGKNKE